MPLVLNKNVDMCKFCFECNNYVSFSYKYVVLIGEKEINQPLWSWGGWGIISVFVFYLAYLSLTKNEVKMNELWMIVVVYCVVHVLHGST